MLDIQVDEADSYTVCRPVGELDAYTVGQFRDALGELADKRYLLIDLSSVPFMDSAGLGALIGGIRRAREAGGDVAVACSRPTLTRLLHTTGFDRIVPVKDTVEDAAAALDDAAASIDEHGADIAGLRPARGHRAPQARPNTYPATSSIPARSWTSLRRKGTHTTGAGATASVSPTRWPCSRLATACKSARLR